MWMRPLYWHWQPCALMNIHRERMILHQILLNSTHSKTYISVMTMILQVRFIAQMGQPFFLVQMMEPYVYGT